VVPSHGASESSHRNPSTAAWTARRTFSRKVSRSRCRGRGSSEVVYTLALPAFGTAWSRYHVGTESGRLHGTVDTVVPAPATRPMASTSSELDSELIHGQYDCDCSKEEVISAAYLHNHGQHSSAMISSWTSDRSWKQSDAKDLRLLQAPWRHVLADCAPIAGSWIRSGGAGMSAMGLSSGRQQQTSHTRPAS
jgi:hypothetical protein